MSKETLADALPRYFSFQGAFSQADRERIYKLRHEVYCQEFHYFREQDCPNEQETDRYDPGALHCALIHRHSDCLAGCVRLIEPAAANNVLPLEFFCGQSLNHPTLHPDKLPQSEVCEISRLAVSAHFRRRNGEQTSALGRVDGLLSPEPGSRVFPLISMAMFLAATALVRQTGRRHVFAMMEQRLARLLGRAGLHFIQVGEPVDYHGLRAAYYIDQTVAEQTMNAGLKGLYADICKQLDCPTAQPHASSVSEHCGP